MNNRQKGKTAIIAKYLLVFLCVSLLGLMLNVAAFLLPDNRIHEHVMGAAETFRQEGTFPRLIQGYDGSIPDNNTDAWMLLLADYHGNENPLNKALMAYYSVYTNEHTNFYGIDSIVCADKNDVVEARTYTRYWHGWIFPLRFALIFFTYSDIRMLLQVIQMLLTMLAIIGLYKNKLYSSLIPFGVALLFLMPSTISQSIDYSCVYLIMLAAIAYLCWVSDTIEKIGYDVFFLILGMLTSYNDFLTAPLITLGLPLIVLLDLRRSKTTLNAQITMVMKCTILWGVGYFGMWAMKWLFAFLLADYSIADAVDRARFRTSNSFNEQVITYIDALVQNLRVIKKRPYVLLIVFGMINAILPWKTEKKISKHSCKILLGVPYLIIGLYPFIWWYALRNHSYLHWHFTYRNISVFVFAFLEHLGYIISTYKSQKQLDPAEL